MLEGVSVLLTIAMIKVDYKLSIAGWSVDSTQDAKTELVELETYASMDSPVNACRIALYSPPAPQPSLLEQAVGAAASAIGLGNGGGSGSGFSVQVRGQKVKFGDTMTIELTAGDASATVMTATVQSVRSSFGLLQLNGATGMQQLATTRVNQIYSSQTLNQIVSDLANQAGVNAGTIDSGGTYPYFVVHESRSALAHVRELAALEGMDVYFDTSNQLNVTAFRKSNADHTFNFGIDVLDLELNKVDGPVTHVVTYGESPASNQGSDTWHWLVKDLSPFQGDAGDTARLLTLGDRALRTKDAAAQYAAAKLGTIKDHSSVGRLVLMGNPQVALGDAFEIKNAKQPELNGLFRATWVRHVLSKSQGYLTQVGFSGQGGAQQAGSALGQLGGMAAGAIGL
jgi:hypothetical protein